MTYTYIAKNGVVVTTPHQDRGPEEDFKTVFHYLCWSYKSWWDKMTTGAFISPGK